MVNFWRVAEAEINPDRVDAPVLQYRQQLIRLRVMRVRVYFRWKGQAEFSDMGNREMGSVPANDDKVVVKFAGDAVQANVCRVRTFLPREHHPAQDPEVYLEST